MTDLTPESCRDAAEVMRLIAIRLGVNHEWPRTPLDLIQYAYLLEREQAAEAKRDKRIKELAGELLNLHLATGISGKWADFARALLDLYPALAEGNT